MPAVGQKELLPKLLKAGGKKFSLSPKYYLTMPADMAQ